MAEVLPVQVQPEGQSYFSPSSIRRPSPSQTSFIIGSPPYSSRKSKYTQPSVEEPLADSLPSSSSSSSSSSQIDLTHPSSFVSTASTSLTLDTTFDLNDGLSFPSYGGGGYMDDEDLDPPPSPRTDNSYTVPSPTSDTTPTHTPDTHIVSEDDTAIKQEPSRHVDYLSHDWREEDIWSSWRHIVSKRRLYGERSRLENASWRTWAKQKNKLKTVPPDTLNWLKDCDVTWLYGPLQTATTYSVSQPTSEPPSNLSKNNSFLSKKPILKKRSMSEVMLQKSISASSLLKQAAAAVQAQQDQPSLRERPILGRATSDFVTSIIHPHPISRDTDYFSSRSTSGLQTPDHGEKKHIRFDDKVEQCIAVDLKEGDYDDDDEDIWTANNDDSDSSSDDGIVMMKKSNRKRPISRSNSKTNLAENKIIEKLEPTTLKYRTDSPDVPDHPSHSVGPSIWRKGNLSPSPSQETLRPSNPSRNFLLEDDDDDDDISWEPSGAFPNQTRKDSMGPGERGAEEGDGEDEEGSGGLRRTPSGMFMPYDEDEEAKNTGLLGKMVDTVNTAKDIAHVIWNVGWRA